MKAVIPAAGFGTRFLPFTKAVPKELVPLVDKPVIQYVVEEAAAAGADEILVILSCGKEAIARHFNPETELEQRLEATGKTKILEELRAIGSGVKIHYIYQPVLNGLGGAVRLARSFVGDAPFAVLLGDTVTVNGEPGAVTGELMKVFQQKHAPVVAAESVPMELVSRYGVLAGKEEETGVFKLTDLVEKPAPEKAPGNLVIASRYIFTPDIFDELDATPPGKNNEVQLTDAMRSLLAKREMYALKVRGKRYDAGDKLSFLRSTVEFALRRPEFHDAFLAYLKETVTKNS